MVAHCRCNVYRTLSPTLSMSFQMVGWLAFCCSQCWLVYARVLVENKTQPNLSRNLTCPIAETWKICTTYTQNWIFNFISIRYTRQVKPHDLYIVMNKIRQWNKFSAVALDDSISTPAAAAATAFVLLRFFLQIFDFNKLFRVEIQ